ncbi:response regulator transcription factor [Capillimicrobium parvum]|uniref:Transcriptional regulatory protein DegU n=1 Tax=Capillimicrobium parvum TaxID=2884022 RepID=A0A9E6Y0B9_9ACTN|nr:response regulator transcription factor [Capillimicrobium parvum]UGS37790.1 Transcriptional regulatory protein DegU [Capillimicrobium parvum]
MAISVVLAEDSLIVREGIAGLLAGEPEIEVVGLCADFDSLIEAVEQHQPDVVVTDIRMPPTHTDEGIRAAVSLAERGLTIGVVVLSNYADPAYAVALLDSGVPGRSYLLKERVHDRAQLVSAIHAVAVGGSMVDPMIIEPLIAARISNERSPLAALTAREREVLADLAEGKSNAAIADSLVLTKRAVEKHINSIFMKLNLVTDEDVSRRVKATLMFLADARADGGIGGRPSGS